MADKAQLVLEDGRVFAGERFGARVEALGEVVFNTSMSGYQEILTDPSYAGQIVCMTYPLIGNTGANDEDTEGRRIFSAGFIIRSLSLIPSSWRVKMTLEQYLEEAGIPGICELDTRALTKHLREKGSMAGMIADAGDDPSALVEKMKSHPPMLGRDLVKDITCESPYPWTQGTWRLDSGYANYSDRKNAHKIVCLDFGVKRNILRLLAEAGFAITVVPAKTTAEEILAMNPDGVFLSNGPGDPEPVAYAVETVKKLIGKKPIFGICLGHQILGLALGAKSYKLKFGHHGANQPVKDMATGRVEITSQNHNFAIDLSSIENLVRPTHYNLNDDTNEGMAHRELPIFSVQYHPEASPGPHDSAYLFERFKDLISG